MPSALFARGARLRWRLACWLDDRRPDACWADLVEWSLKTEGYTLRKAAGPRGRACQSDIDEGRGCWCGKVRAERDSEPPRDDPREDSNQGPSGSRASSEGDA